MKKILYIGNNLKHKKVNPSSINTLGTLLEKEGYKMFYASSKKNKLLRLLDMLYHCVQYRKQVDVVLIDTYSTLNFYFAFLVSQLCIVLKIKYIPILHGGNLVSRLDNNPKMTKAIFNFAQTNVSPSLFIKEQFEDFGFHNIVYIPNSIEIDNYPFYVPEIKSIKLLWVRSFSKIYNPNLAILIAKKLKDLGTKVTLCMVGPDSDGSLFKAKQLAEELEVAVTFTGKLNKKDWINLSKDYNVFINTTNFDNMPVSVIEAMALGLPVVATNVGGLPYLIENEVDGLLVNPNQVEEFVKAINQLATNPDLATKIITNARKKAEQLDWSIIKQKWQSVL